jgi:nitrogen fixation/metabolism regulation signal transduction histidine kinase
MQALQPLFEAVSNAMHAVEDHFGAAAAVEQGRIDVTITDAKDPQKLAIVIQDNGVGLDNRRYEAFATTDTDFKIVRGGKGVGRLLWLDAFQKIRVC